MSEEKQSPEVTYYLDGARIPGTSLTRWTLFKETREKIGETTSEQVRDQWDREFNPDTFEEF